MRKSISAKLALAAFVASLSLAACNTIQGAGEDVKATGQAVSDTAADAKQEIAK